MTAFLSAPLKTSQCNGPHKEHTNHLSLFPNVWGLHLFPARKALLLGSVRLLFFSFLCYATKEPPHTYRIFFFRENFLTLQRPHPLIDMTDGHFFPLAVARINHPQFATSFQYSSPPFSWCGIHAFLRAFSYIFFFEGMLISSFF